MQYCRLLLLTAGCLQFGSSNLTKLKRDSAFHSSEDYHHASRVSHVSSLPHARSHHGRYYDENPVVHFFRNIVSPRTTPPLQAKGGETHRPGYGSGKFYEHKYAHKGHKGYRYDGQGTLSKLFKLGSSGSRPGSRSGSPVARR